VPCRSSGISLGIGVKFELVEQGFELSLLEMPAGTTAYRS